MPKIRLKGMSGLKMTTLKEARNTEVFVINENQEIEKVNLAEFVLESQDETTTPRGVGARVFIEHVIHHVDEEDIDIQDWPYLYDECRYADIDDCKTVSGGYELHYYGISSWGVGGNNYSDTGDYFLSEDAAENELFQRVWKYDFESDDTRDTQYFESREDAEIELVERLAGEWYVDDEVALHIYNKMKKAAVLRAEAERKEAEESARRTELLNAEYDRQAEAYSQLIEPIADEKYKQTAARLSAALKEKISSRVFHKSVKLIRRKK